MKHLRNENVPRVKRIENHLGNIPPIKTSRIDVVVEAPRTGPRSWT
jgi:hypothetical protein